MIGVILTEQTYYEYLNSSFPNPTLGEKKGEKENMEKMLGALPAEGFLHLTSSPHPSNLYH